MEDGTAQSEIHQTKGHFYRMVAAGVPVFEAERLREAGGEADGWLAAWTETGERYARMGEEALLLGRSRTAGEYLALASVLYHFGQFLYYGDGERKSAAQDRRAALYRRAAPLLDPPAERVEVPFEKAAVFGYLRRPPGAGARPPVVALVPGLEATKEEMRTLEDVFLARGMATFAFDGPGQGETHSRLPLGGDYPEAASAVADWLEGERLDAGRMAIVGVSLGGLLAPLAAASDARWRCCAGVGGPFDLVSRWDSARSLTRKGYRYVTRAASDGETLERLRPLSMERARGLKTPTLIVHGSLDQVVPLDQAVRFKEIAAVEFTVMDGANHVCHNMGHICRPLVADWVAAKLQAL